MCGDIPRTCNFYHRYAEHTGDNIEIFLLLLHRACTALKPFWLFILVQYQGDWQYMGGWDGTQPGNNPNLDIKKGIANPRVISIFFSSPLQVCGGMLFCYKFIMVCSVTPMRMVCP